MAALFEHQYGVPKDMILLEVPMSYYVEELPEERILLFICIMKIQINMSFWIRYLHTGR